MNGDDEDRAAAGEELALMCGLPSIVELYFENGHARMRCVLLDHETARRFQELKSIYFS